MRRLVAYAFEFEFGDELISSVSGYEGRVIGVLWYESL